MKKTNSFLALGIMIASSVTAVADVNSVLDPVSQATLRHASLPVVLPGETGRHKAPGVSADSQIALVRLSDGASADDLVADGFDAVPLRHGFAVVTCAAGDAKRLVKHRAVSQCEFNRRRTPNLQLARASASIDAVHAGTGISMPFTGKGVITGIVDSGFDPNHVNFKDSEGNSRIEYFTTVEINNTGTGIRITPYTPEQLSYFSTDDNTQTHGTHTLGIMAGSFNGEALVGSYDHATDQTHVGKQPSPYYGAAPGSRIYASTGSTYDALIANAIDGMLAYRWDNDFFTPVVINLSLGGNSGPHDGSGLLCQYLDAAAAYDGAVFCVSSGNEGDLPIALHKTFTEGDTQVATFIRPYVYTNVRYGMIEIYSDTDQPFDLSAIIYNKARGRVARTIPLNNTDGVIQYVCSSTDYQQDDTDIIDDTFAKAYEGYVGLAGLIDEESGRFKAVIDYYTVNSDQNPADDTTEAQYTLGFIITGNEGQRIDCFCDGTFTALDSYGYSGYADGTRNGSISDIATAKSVIAVGSYNTSEWSSNISGQPIGYNGYFKLNEVTDFSSYGSLVDGRDLPHVLAPGCLVVSSISTPYVNNSSNGITEEVITAKYEDGKRNHYFQPMMGTSMATPLVSGVAALVLEANPDLTFEEVRDLIVGTAVVEDSFLSVEDPVQYGAGHIDAYEAVKGALRMADSIETVTDDSHTLIKSLGDNRWTVYVDGATEVSVQLYSLDGRTAACRNAAGDEATFDFSGIAPGMYILRINAGHSQLITIR